MSEHHAQGENLERFCLDIYRYGSRALELLRRYYEGDLTDLTGGDDSDGDDAPAAAARSKAAAAGSQAVATGPNPSDLRLIEAYFRSWNRRGEIHDVTFNYFCRESTPHLPLPHT